MNIHSPLLDIDMVAPDLIQQKASAVNTLGMGHKKMQQPKFSRTKIQSDFAGVVDCPKPMRCGIKPQPTDGDDVIGELRCPPAHHGLDSGHQFLWRERLGDVVIRTRFQALNLVALIAAGGQHDDGNVSRSFIGTKLFRKPNAGHSGQHPVQ